LTAATSHPFAAQGRYLVGEIVKTVRTRRGEFGHRLNDVQVERRVLELLARAYAEGFAAATLDGKREDATLDTVRAMANAVLDAGAKSTDLGDAQLQSARRVPCPTCGELTAVNLSGRLRRHTDYRTWPTSTCVGSGKRVAAPVEKRP
jgi:hypothetical protein